MTVSLPLAGILPSSPVQLLLLIIALPFLSVLAFFLYFLSFAFARLVSVHILRSDDYANLPRPRHGTWTFPVFGDFPAIRKAPPAEAHLEWMQELGTPVYAYRGIFYSPRLLLADPKALGYLLGSAHSYEYPKPSGTRLFLKSLLGEGLLVAEGDVHRRQRKVLQPAFNVSAIRDLTPTFFKHTNALAARLGGLCDSTEGPSTTPFITGQSLASAAISEPKKPVIDVSFWLGRTTLDVIGEAGFDYHFKSLGKGDGDEEDEVGSAFNQMMKSSVDLTLLQIVQIYLQNLPGLAWLRKLPTKRRRTINSTYATLERVSARIIGEKRQQIQAEMMGGSTTDGNEKTAASFSKANFDEADRSSSGGRDLLYLMMRASMASDIKERERLDDAELLGQMTTLILAGHETTSTQTSWALWLLARHPEVQDRLRAEIEDTFAGRDEVDYDTLMQMPYLDKVSKEMMRHVSPVTSTTRVAVSDDVIPLGQAYKTRNGKGSYDSVIVRKGQDIMIPIQVVNASPFIWGPTADKFDPDRWDNLPATARDSGMPSHLLTFISGPRGCIGNRFAIAEFKALLCSLIQNLRFEEVPGWAIEKKQSIVLRPRVKGQEELGMQMPLRVSRV